MDILLVILGFVCVLIGILGVFIPGLPGPPLCWVGIPLLYFTEAIDFNYWVLIPLGLVAILSLILEYTIPAFGTKVLKGTKYGVRGSYIGLVVGLLTPIPFGFILGPFCGAFAGELYYDQNDWKRALKAAFGTFIGFLVSILINLGFALLFLLVFIILVFYHFSELF